jgi:spermidine synthase
VSKPSLAWLLPLLAASGCAALVYEIIWFQLLQLVIGSSAISLGLLLAAYMGGLCLGSVAIGRLAPEKSHPLRVYAFLELGIGIFGAAILFALPFLGRIYLAGAEGGTRGVVLRGFIAALCLLPPTLLMGATFPVLARMLETTPRGISRLGLLYSANIAGAVFGCVLSGFYLLRLYDMAAATYTAVAINVVVAAIAFALSRSAAFATAHTIEGPTPAEAAPHAPGAAGVYLAIALSGLAALGSEVIWTRLLSLLLGATVYTFSIILAVFLLGLWAGSAAGALLARRVADPRLALAGCQILAALAIAFTAYTLAFSLPYWPVDPWLSTNPLFNFDLDVTRCLRTIFPPTLLWGASFPMALASMARSGEDAARFSGRVYAANTAGSILGALAFSLWLVPVIGTRGAHQLLIWLSVAAAAAVIIPTLRVRPIRAATLLVTAMTLALVLTWSVAGVPWQAIAYGRRVAPILRGIDISAEAEPLFVGEGINSSVVITDRAGQRFFYVSGKSEASTAILDMRNQRMLGHLPALLHPNPRSVLVVGFGAGVTAGSFIPYPEVQSIVICEFEPMIPPASNKFFAQQNYRVLDDSRTRTVYDDARHYISVTRDKFDVITTDPIHPWVKGTSALYSKEYYELVREHLNPGGVVAQWLPIYESDEETVKSEMATFFEVFPNATIWSNYLNGDGYDLVLVGRLDETPINVDELQRRLNQPAYERVAASLAEVEFRSAVDLMAAYAGRATDLKSLVAQAEINRDRNMRLQYLAGLGLNSVSGAQIYRRVMFYRRFPEDLITGSGEPFEVLRETLDRPYRTF